jgi:glycosyltransferase involved in cell wall biosynthesis
MGAWYHWADVLVLPSVSDTFGLVILEAMAAGLPVIASEASGGPDVVRHGTDGWIVPVRDAAAIATRLDILASSATLVSQMGEAARQQASDFGAEAYAAKLLEAIAS